MSRHHRLVHEGGFQVIAGQDGVRFLNPAGHDLARRNPPTPTAVPDVSDMPPTWDGNRVDYGDVLECLMA